MAFRTFIRTMKDNLIAFIKGVPTPPEATTPDAAAPANHPEPVLNEAPGIPGTPAPVASGQSGQNDRTTASVPRKPQWNENTITVLGTDIHSNEEVSISLDDQRLSSAAIGSTGTGKTTLVGNMILSAIRDNHGVCVVEPHGDLIRSVLSGIPPEFLKKVYLLDLADSADNPVGINLFSCPKPRSIKNIAATSSFVSHVFEKVWGAGTETPRLMMVLRAITRTLIENSPDATFTEIPLLLQHEGIRQVMAKSLTNSSISSFWEAYDHRSQRDRDELTASTLNKVVSFLDQDLIRNIVGQSKTTLNFREIMDEGKILLVSLSPQYEEASRLLGSVLIGQILLAAFSRADTPEQERRPFFLFCDEYQRFATSDFATLLAESRKFKIITFLCNQTLAQLDELNQAAALQAGNIISFRTNGEDSKVICKSYDATPTPEIVGEEPVRADPLSHLVKHGHPHPAVAKLVSGYLLPLENLARYIGSLMGRPLWAGPLNITQQTVIEARGLLNETLITCMREGKADLFLPPLILLILGIAEGSGIPHAMVSDCRIGFLEYGEFQGFHRSANRFGDPGFLQNAPLLSYLKERHATKRVSHNGRKLWQTPGPSLIALVSLLRQTMQVLSKEPMLTDTGLFQPRYQLRSYIDQENLIANELSTLPRYTARVRLISGREHTIRTLPAPARLSEREIDERIAAIKQRMLFFGICKPYAQVQREIDLRQAMWRQRAEADIPPPPPLHTNGNGRRNGRQKSPARSSTGSQ